MFEQKKQILSLTFSKKFQRTQTKQEAQIANAQKYKFKTPKPQQGKTHHCLTGDRFIPLKSDKENLQNFLLKNLSNSVRKIQSTRNSPQRERKYSNMLFDSLLLNSADDFSIDKSRLPSKSKQILSFSKKASSSQSKPFLHQMKNYFIAQNYLQEKPSTRIISPIPERILDAPNLIDDYYLNLLDWGSLNVLSVALGSEVYLWNGETAETSLLMSAEQDENTISSISWMNSGNCLAIGFHSGVIELWDTVKGMEIRKMYGHNNRVSTLAWNGYMISSGGKDTKIINHDVRSRNHLISCLTSHRQEVCQLKFNNDGSYLASGGNDNTMFIWDVKKMGNKLQSIFFDNESEKIIRPYQTMTAHCAAVKAMGWCPWMRNVIATGGGTRDKTIKFYNCDSGHVMQSINSGSQVCALLWNKRERELISSHGYNKNQICVWNYPKMTKVTELKGHMSRVLYLAMSPDETTIVSGAGDETLRFWKINDKINEISREEDEEICCGLKLR